MDDTTRSDDTTGNKDWTGEEWAGEVAKPSAEGSATATWNKEQWVGDQGDGAPEPQDPATMPEGDTTLSGNRHADGEEHWAPGEPTGATTPR